MANIESQKKSNRQNVKRKAANSQVRSSIRTAMKKVNKALDSKEEKNVEQIVLDQRKFEKTIDTAARKGIIHKRTAARKKSRMAQKVNKLKQPA